MHGNLLRARHLRMTMHGLLRLGFGQAAAHCLPRMPLLHTLRLLLFCWMDFLKHASRARISPSVHGGIFLVLYLSLASMTGGMACDLFSSLPAHYTPHNYHINYLYSIKV